MYRLKSKTGFTLIELLIVTVLIGVMAAIAAPKFETAWERQKFRSATRALTSKLRTARSHAISHKEPHGLYVDEEAKTFTVFRDIANLGNLTFDVNDSVLSVDTLPVQFEMFYTDCANGVIMFNPNGSSDFTGGGNIGTLAYSEDTFSWSLHNILASTGRILSQVEYY